MSEDQANGSVVMNKADMLKASIEARVAAAIEEAKAKREAQLEVAEPWLWWNLYATGPYQSFAPNGPLPPHQVIKIGETAFFDVTFVLNPFAILPPPPGMSPCDQLSNFGLPYEITYQTCNLTTCSKGGPNGVITGNLVPGQCVYTNVEAFNPGEEGLFAMHISARILGVGSPNTAPRYAGFARWVYDYDPELFWAAPTPGWQYDLPMKFMVYR